MTRVREFATDSAEKGSEKGATSSAVLFSPIMNCAYQYPQAMHPQGAMNVHQPMPQQMHHQPADTEFLEVINRRGANGLDGLPI